jgi:deoxyribodipyrimidine photolyase-related protein
MTCLRLLFPDQLSHSLASLKDLMHEDVILMCELMNEATFIKHHPKKLAFQFATMRHFAAELERKGCNLRYVAITDKDNTQNYKDEILRAAKYFHIKKLVITEPSEYRLLQIVESLKSEMDIEIKNDDRFLYNIDEFKNWASGFKQLRMEFFYRHMRKKYQILLEEDGSPIGGKWNFDQENRKPPTKNLKGSRRISHQKSIILQEVLALVQEKFSEHFGDLDPFYYALTRAQAIIELDDFIDHILPFFGDYQDAMVKGEPYLNHSLLSSYINAGLLLPLEICKKAEQAYKEGKVSLNSAEGFIRQILGWREYIRGIYWLKMPKYAQLNYFNTKRTLPAFYWGAPTYMSCIAEVVMQTKEHAYSHHIQRLMVTGNFALLAGIDVKEVQEWYLAVYSDAYEWVEMPNTLGMALFGDGGIVGSKPYAASGKYINKMSNFCQGCYYDPNETTGERACPFNSLYWDFLSRNKSKLINNQRLGYVYSTWEKFSQDKQLEIKNKAQAIFSKLDNGTL